MKVILVCNNFGAKYDGIGAYVEKLYNSLIVNGSDVKIYTAYCKPNEMLKRIFGFGMTRAIFRATKDILFEKFNKAIIEYPFVEWNPLFCLGVLILKIATVLTGTELIVIIHEYKRVNIIRKAVIIYLTLLGNKILVTEKENFDLLKKYNDKINKINIPSNIDIQYDKNIEKKKEFVYFGIVNKAKAFNEMMTAWDDFNCDSKYKLYCITSSKLKNMEKHKNVEYIFNASDVIINKIMCRSVFSIVPIKPFVDEKNATFKTSCLAGCVSIGNFCEEYKKLPFVVNVDNYKKESFIEAFEKSINIDNTTIKQLSLNAVEFGKEYSIENNVKKYVET